MKIVHRLLLSVAIACSVSLSLGQGLPQKAQTKVDRWIAAAQELAAHPEIVKAVAAQNVELPPELATMTEEKWSQLADMDPVVRSFTKNAAAQAMRTRKPEGNTEAFLSDSTGQKVAFLSKTTAWSHKDKPKHEVPMSGKTWQGKLELDKSTQVRQLQIAVPVLQAGKPIGSLVQGFSMTDLAAD